MSPAATCVAAAGRSGSGFAGGSALGSGCARATSAGGGSWRASSGSGRMRATASDSFAETGASRIDAAKKAVPHAITAA